VINGPLAARGRLSWSTGSPGSKGKSEDALAEKACPRKWIGCINMPQGHRTACALVDELYLKEAPQRLHDTNEKSAPLAAFNAAMGS